MSGARRYRGGPRPPSWKCRPPWYSSIWTGGCLNYIGINLFQPWGYQIEGWPCEGWGQQDEVWGWWWFFQFWYPISMWQWCQWARWGATWYFCLTLMYWATCYCCQLLSHLRSLYGWNPVAPFWSSSLAVTPYMQPGHANHPSTGKIMARSRP